MNHYRALSSFIVTVFFIGLMGITFSAQAVVISSAGKIIAADGTVDAVNNKEKRPIKRGDDFYVEDTILTEDKSTVSLRFTDGTLLELKEKSSFVIKEYKFKESTPEDDSYSAQLIKGGFRTITGALGKRNPDHYEVQARTTTLTIRGTEIVMDMNGDNVQVGLLEGAATVASGNNKVDLEPNTNAAINANGYIVRGQGIPASMMRGFSSNNINTLREQAKKAGYPVSTTAPASDSSGEGRTFIEGEGAAKPRPPVGGSSPCEGISGMSASMPQ